VEWRTAPGDDPRDLDRVEGVILGLNEQTLRLKVPFIGVIEVPRESLRRIIVQGRSSRVVVDTRARHLGDRLALDIDPPQAEAAPVEIKFPIADIPRGPAWLLIDTVKVIGEEGTPEYSELVKQGQLRTSLSLNGQKVDDLNGYVTSRNDAPERLRIPLPAAALRPGINVLRFDQSGTKAAPTLRDNLGLLRIAVEFTPSEKAKAGGP
jgi:hypothetical protein